MGTKKAKTEEPTCVALDSAGPSRCEISAVSYEGFSIATSDGRPAKLAVIDEDGQIVEAGPKIADVVWDVAIAAYRQFLMGSGHLRVLSRPGDTAR
ncbi:hypothetical protein [Burkholderia multivorans]|uniref:hypothetical protein n=1 Tax=Burkholderia multivorans TaxID=87883 RepID=UPI0020B358E4|nr:hypothetical protein [Burkholderia multivorans]MDN7510932.1 hypothetical protein [Burkholderia multivorans]